jgi:hypothetical protein
MQLGKDFIVKVKWSTLPCNILFPQHVVQEDCRHVIWIRQIGRWTEASEFEEVIDCLGIHSYHYRPKNLLVIVIDTTLDVLDVDGHDPYETVVVTTWIWYAKDFVPLYVVSLPSGLCFKV